MAPSANQSSSAAAFAVGDCRGVRRASCAGACCQSRTASADVGEHAREDRAPSSCRPRASARSSSMYIRDSRRLLSRAHAPRRLRACPCASRVDADDRMKQAVDGQLARGDGIGDRIDQERHVVVDDADAHPAVAGLAADGFDRQRETRRACGWRATWRGTRRLRAPHRGSSPAFRRAGHCRSAPCESTRPAAGQARMSRHGNDLLREVERAAAAYRPAPRERDNPAACR